MSSATTIGNEYVITETSFDNQDVQLLISQLDQYQLSLYGAEMCNLDSVETLKQSGAYVLGAYRENKLIGIGAVKLLDGYAEIKRMYVDEAARGGGVAGKIISALESYAKGRGINQIFLETGCLQPNAINFYKLQGYTIVDSFGRYQPNSVSVYFSKEI